MSISEIAKTIKKFLVLTIRLSYRSVCNHPILISFGLLLLFFYHFFPSLFSFLLSTSPVLVCTTLLLGTILSFGQPNIPQFEEEEEEDEEEKEEQQQQEEKTINSDQLSSFSASAATNNIVANHNETSAVQNTREYQKPDISERELDEVSFTKQAVTFSPENFALSKETVQEKESVLSDERSFSIEREVGESSLVFLSNPVLEESVDSPHWQRIDSHDASSGFESDGAESSSPDASMTDIIPLLEEIDPLLDPDSSPQQNQNLNDDSDSSSQASSHDLLQIESADEEEEEDKSAKKDDEAHENAFTWTADDQKNLMDLGYSEAERNRRLENLMARRRSRKNIRFELDRNLINLDGNTIGSSSISTAFDDLSQFRIHVSPVSAPRENPFDSSFGLEIPGSAPSVLAPRRNPFDEPYEEPTESMILPHESWSPRQYMSASHRDVFYTRHDSFNYSSGEFGQGRQFSRFKPFVSDSYTNTIREGSSSNIGTFERQFSGDSESQSSSALETGSSYIADPILGSNPVRDDEEQGEDEGSISSDDISSVAVQLDNSEFELNGGRESPSIPSRFFSSSENVGLVDSVPDLLCLDDVAAEDGSGANTSNKPTSRRLDFTPREFEDNCMPVEANIPPLASDLVPDLLRWDDVAAEDGPGASTSNQPTSRRLDFTPREFEDNCNTLEENITSLDSNSVPDLIRGANVAAEDGHGASTSDQTTSRRFDFTPREFEDDWKPSESNIALLASEQIPVPSQENSTRTSQFNLMDLHSIPEEETTEETKPDKNNQEVLGPVESDRDSDEDAEQIYPEPVEYNEIDEDLLTELDAVGDFAPRHQISCLELENTVIDSGHQIPVPQSTVVETAADLVLIPNENLEQTVYNPRQRILQSTSAEEVNAFLNEIPNESHYSQKSGEQEQSDMVDLSSEIAESEIPGTAEEADSGMLTVKAKSLADIESAFVQVANSLAGGENTGIVDETESGMLVLKAKSIVDINTAFEQVREVLRGSADTQTENADMGMVFLEAKSIDDIESAMMQVSGLTANEDVGLVDETESGMLVVKANSKEDIDLVFKQVGEVIGNKVPNGGFAEGDSSDMLAFDAKHINDIDSVMLNASEELEGTSSMEGGDAGLLDETDSGLLVVKAKSLADIESVFKQVGEVLRPPVAESGNAGSDQIAGGSDNGMLVLDARSINDIDSAILNASEATGSGDAGLVDETESGMLVIKANCLADINSTFKQVGEVLGTSDRGSESPKLVEDTNSGIMLLDAKSIEDIDLAIMQITEVTGTEDSGMVDETESGMLVVKANSLADIDSVFQQVGEVLGNRNGNTENLGIVEDSHLGMLVVNAKSVNGIESAMLQISESTDNTEAGLIDETDSGMLVVKASSVADINAVFLQVGEVLGKQSAESENPGIVEDADSGMLVLDAKSVEDIDSAMLHVSENCGDGIEETESGMLVLKAKSLEDIDSVLKKAGEVLIESSGGPPESVEETESGMLIVKAKSLEDINSAMKHVSSVAEVGNSEVAAELPVVNGLNMQKE